MNANPSPTSPGHHFFAGFGLSGDPGCLVRKDTRVYLHPQNPATTSRKSGRCAGVVWMCNPGSAGAPAGPSAWGPLPPDPTLRAVLAMYQKAAMAKSLSPGAVEDVAASRTEYILVMNCYYSADPDYAVAYANWIASKCSYRENIPKKARFVIAAWGSNKPQGPVAKAVRTIQQRRKKKNSAPFVVYIDAPVLRPGAPRLSSRLAVMNYPVHPLNPGFSSKPLGLATALAPYV